MKDKKQSKKYADDYEPIEDTLKTICLELMDCVGDSKDDERKQKLAVAMLRTVSFRLNEGENDLPHPRKFIDKWQWENSVLINETQMMALCNEIIFILDKRQKGLILRD